MQFGNNLLLFLVIFIHSNNVGGGPTVTIIVTRTSVSVGFDEFAAFSMRPFNVSCRADPTPLDLTLELFQNNDRIGVTTESSLTNTLELNSSSEQPTIIRCRLLVMSNRYVRYVVERYVLFTVWLGMPPTPRCISSIGSSGTVRESSDLLCATSYPINASESVRLMWSGVTDEPSIRRRIGEISFIRPSVEVSKFSNPMICYVKRDGKTEEVCRLPDFEIISEPTVSISPKTFSANADSMSFSCQSNPPSRIRWVITGDDGDILDYDLRVNFSLEEELKVTIKEITGTSNISLSGSAVPSLRVDTIYCITYGRQYTRIGVAQKETTFAGSNDTSYIVVISIFVVITLTLAVWCALLYLRRRISSEPTKTSEEDNLENINPSYEPYQPPEQGGEPYMEITDVKNTNIHQEDPADGYYQSPSL